MFLPYDLYAEVKGPKNYKDKYRLICKPNGALLVDTVKQVKGKGPRCCRNRHAHSCRYMGAQLFCWNTFSCNNTDEHFFEFIPDGNGGEKQRPVRFAHNPAQKEDLDKGNYAGCLYQATEYSIMSLGHGRAGHLPDYSSVKYRYLPAWGQYEEIIKDNPSDYMHTFCQMIYVIKYLRGEHEDFVVNTYDEEAVAGIRDEIDTILRKRQVDSCDDWQAFGQKISGREVPDFDIDAYEKEYMEASEEDKPKTWMGQFLNAAIAQKSMVTNRIHKSGSTLAGISVVVSKDDSILANAVAAGEELVNNAKADAEEAGKELKETIQDTAENLNDLADQNSGEGGGTDE